MTSVNPKNPKPMTEELRRRLRDEAAKELGYLVMSGDYELVERLAPEGTPNATESVGDENVAGLVQAAVKIAQQRTARLLKLRTALQANDHAEVLRLAPTVCGLREEDEDETRDPATPRIN